MNLNQITIQSLDVDKSVEFYTVLGLSLIVNASPRYVRLECLDGESTFSIHKVDKLPKENGITIYFEVKNLPVTVKALKQKGIIFNTEIMEQPWLWSEINLTDPDGYNIIIYHAGDNRKNPPWKVN